MPERWFQPKVPVRDHDGHRYNVGSVEAAAEVLMTWPRGGPMWTKAVQACVAALEGKEPPESVRLPFEAAAREAGKLLPVIKDF